MSDERADCPADLRLRASDTERDVVAGRLREAHAEGRLTVEEFSERLDLRSRVPGRGRPGLLLAGLGGRTVGRGAAGPHAGRWPSPGRGVTAVTAGPSGFAFRPGVT